MTFSGKRVFSIRSYSVSNTKYRACLNVP